MQALDWITTYIINLEVSCKDLQIFYDLFWIEKDFLHLSEYIFLCSTTYIAQVSLSLGTLGGQPLRSAIYFLKVHRTHYPITHWPLTQTHQTHTEPTQPYIFSAPRCTLYKPYLFWKLTTPTTHWPNDHLPTCTLLLYEPILQGIAWPSECCSTSSFLKTSFCLLSNV